MPNCPAKSQKVINQLCETFYPYGCGTQCKNLYKRWLDTVAEVRELEKQSGKRISKEGDKKMSNKKNERLVNCNNCNTHLGKFEFDRFTCNPNSIDTFIKDTYKDNTVKLELICPLCKCKCEVIT